MATELTKNGSDKHQKGEFRYEKVKTWVTQKEMIQWSYRSADGTLHKGIAPDWEKAIEEARKLGFSL
jgi:hypothetical protein